MKLQVCGSTELAPGKSISTSAGEIRVAVFRVADGTLFALEDRCPHRGARLSEGVIYDEFVACRDHGWSVCLRHGEVQAPERGKAVSFPVITEDGLIYVVLPSPEG